MKNVKSILNHIFPIKKRFNEHKCFHKIVSLLPKNLKEHVLFCYIKNGTLFFVLDHPGIKMEFNYNKKLINELLNIAQKNILECNDLKIKDFKSFISHKKKELISIKTNSTYYEKAKGDFEIFAKKDEIKSIFEKIQKAIKNNR